MTRLLGLALLLSASATAHARDWPQWMGPQRDGLTSETGLLKEWPEGGPKRVWLNREVGLGYSGPAIADGKLYTLGSRDGVEQLIALDADTGDELWAVDLGQEYENDWGNGPRNTPTVDDGRVYALAARGALVCVSADSGDPIWKKQLQDFGGETPNWGYAESPLVDDGRVVVTPGGEKGAILALDKLTGERIWQAEELTPIAHYSSIVVGSPNGQKQYIQLLQDQLVGVAPDSGELLWSVPWPGRVAVIPTPLVEGNRVYATTAYGIGCMLVEIAPDNTPEVVYENKVIKNKHGGVILLDGHVYGHSDGAGWVCQDFDTGELVWRERSALDAGSLGYADERLYLLSEDGGEVVLLEPSPKEWIEKGRFTLEPQTDLRKPKGKIWVHPVIANGKLYLRDQELLFCFDVSAE
ncbi:PQQ-binding-like beta-propeller repeat protein [Botrimarina sp.]|uniref:outer membrane protein assembly factor BamB family protein n=1 Tax=Botrimarina sp. TaxID=2795802 RepID=UPI0032ED9D50